MNDINNMIVENQSLEEKRKLLENLKSSVHELEIQIHGIEVCTDEVLRRIPIMSNTLANCFFSLANIGKNASGKFWGPLYELSENFEPGHHAYTNDDSDPLHSLIQAITARCGCIDSYHAATIHKLIQSENLNGFWTNKQLVIEFYENVLAIAKALPDYRGHARV